REAGDRDPDSVARAGLLCRLGCWAAAAVDPDWFARWSQADSQASRRHLEFSELGGDLDTLGIRLAERWGCDRLVADAAWLYGEHGPSLYDAANEPARLAFIQEACRLADQTPWALGNRPSREARSTDPRLRILIAEVQARGRGAFVATDATIHEERVTRQNARLRLLLAAERERTGRSNRFLRALADSDPAESLDEWTSRAAMTWCAEPGASAARLVWLDAAARTEARTRGPAVPVEDDRSSEPCWEQRQPTL